MLFYFGMIMLDKKEFTQKIKKVLTRAEKHDIIRYLKTKGFDINVKRKIIRANG